jgi:hypothetical protein
MKYYLGLILSLCCCLANAQFVNTDPDAPLFTGGNFGNETVTSVGAGGPGTTTCPSGVPNGQPYGTPNFGCFGFLEQWDDLYVSQYGPFWSVSAQIYGTNGGYSCGRGCSGVDYTILPVAPVLVYATPTNTPEPGYCGAQKCSPNQWNIAGSPVTDEFGQPVVFSPVGPLYTLTCSVTPPQTYPYCSYNPPAPGATVVSQISGYHEWAMNAKISTCVLDSTGQACALDSFGKPTLLYYAVDFEGAGATGRGGQIQGSRYLFVRAVQSAPPAPQPPPCTNCNDD